MPQVFGASFPQYFHPLTPGPTSNVIREVQRNFCNFEGFSEKCLGNYRKAI